MKENMVHSFVPLAVLHKEQNLLPFHPLFFNSTTDWILPYLSRSDHKRRATTFLLRGILLYLVPGAGRREDGRGGVRRRGAERWRPRWAGAYEPPADTVEAAADGRAPSAPSVSASPSVLFFDS